ncbi:ammonia monooxygenase [Scandinavium goeteborgense]|uniref:Uncharacterized protein n=1 Tax=Scandinavium goeteborgense TaxID=1851514 RepID=A0A4R6E1B3_SCAGO|nr:ammonia monooxygenase [Scandinavium goeteborgense]TDN51510.1 hypothetical protein EC847_11839 [Scandinavium goeteborgense]
MHTHNVNIKTAAHESSERWGVNPEKRLARVIAEQQSYLNQLCGLWNLQMPEIDESEELLGILSMMAKNVLNEGVISWTCDYPRVSFPVVQPWLQAKKQAVQLYGETGRLAWEQAYKELKDGIEFGLATRPSGSC